MLKERKLPNIYIFKINGEIQASSMQARLHGA